MKKDLSSTLASHMERFVYIGQTRYNGKIHDNVLNIFEDLDVEDKKGLLRSVLRVHRAATVPDVQKETVDSMTTLEPRINPVNPASIQNPPSPTVSPASISEMEEDLRLSSKENTPIINVLIAVAVMAFLTLSVMGFSSSDDTQGYEAIRNSFGTVIDIFK